MSFSVFDFAENDTALFALISARLFSMSGLSGFVFRVTAWHRFSGRHRRTCPHNLSVADMERIFTAFLRTIHGFLRFSVPLPYTLLQDTG